MNSIDNKQQEELLFVGKFENKLNFKSMSQI